MDYETNKQVPIKNENFEGLKVLNIIRVFGKSNDKPGDPQTTTIKMRMLRTAIEKISKYFSR